MRARPEQGLGVRRYLGGGLSRNAGPAPEPERLLGSGHPQLGQERQLALERRRRPRVTMRARLEQGLSVQRGGARLERTLGVRHVPGFIAPPAPALAAAAQAGSYREPTLAAARAAVSRTPIGAAVTGAKRARVSYGTHAQRRFAKAERQADALLAELPPLAAAAAVGEDAGLAPADAEELLRGYFLSKGGPEGGTTAKGMRFLRLLRANAARFGWEHEGLPCPAGRTAYVVRQEQDRATKAAAGSRGGATVGGTIRDGALFLEAGGLAVAAKGALVEAAAQPRGPRVAAPRSHAGSMPIGLQCQVEHVAAGERRSVLRTMARSLLISSLLPSCRLNDALNAEMRPEDAPDVAGKTSVSSKDGLPLEFFCPPEGWLGPIGWLAEHYEEMAGREHAVPDYTSSPANRPSAPTAALAPGVCQPGRARAALRDIAAQPPLLMSGAEFDALSVTTHSPHGSPSDMIRFMAAHGLPAERPFTEPDARAKGHWLRDRNAPQHDPRMTKGAPTRNVPDGAPVANGGMSFRYTQGRGRRGAREEQLEVCARFVREMRRALARADEPWSAMKTLDSWDWLRPAGPAEAEVK